MIGTRDIIHSLMIEWIGVGRVACGVLLDGLPQFIDLFVISVAICRPVTKHHQFQISNLYGPYSFLIHGA